jgi:acetoin:2,6-dichlorophenolindophenol oxidoreductase subunit alpha
MKKEDLISIYRYLVMGHTLAHVFSDTNPGWHSIEGEEAVIVGSFFGLRDSDVISPHYRGPELASYIRGVPLREIFAGILGKATGCSRGRHTNEVCGPFEYNIIGNYSGALGSTLCYAAGAALASKLKKTDDVAVVTFGDGSAARGEFHEAIGMAAMLKLPVVFVCQNNQYAITLAADKHLAGASIADRGVGYNIPGIKVDGMDVLAVREAVQSAVARARAGEGPSLIEAVAYRLSGHFAADNSSYRSVAEVEEWRKKSPVLAYEKYLLDEHVLSQAEANAIREELTREVEMAKTQAFQDPEPDDQDLGLDEVYAVTA